MANPITTTGTTTDPYVTNYDAPELIRDWVTRHTDGLKLKTPSGNTLTTTWTSTGGPQAKTSTRKAGESDADFIDRHCLESTIAMVGNAPIP